MRNNKIKKITIVCILLMVAIVLAYGLYQKSQPNKQTDMSEDNQETMDVKAGDIEEDITVEIPDIKNIESKEEIKDNEQEEVKLEADKPVVPPNPELPESNDKSDITNGESIPSDEDVVKQGDEEENPNPPAYDETPKVEEEPVENPVIVTPDVPNDTSDDNDLVPDSENPFLKSPEQQENNNAPGEHDGSDYGDGEWGTGDKF